MDRLRRCAERTERIDHRAFADRGRAGDADMADQTHAAFKIDLRPDQTIGPDLNVIAKRAPSATRAVESISI
jgi:hypothetical protein